jgi:hypothetical protein
MRWSGWEKLQRRPMVRSGMRSGNFVTSTRKSSVCRKADSAADLDGQFAGDEPTGERPAVIGRAVGIFDQPGLFVARLDRPMVMSAAGRTLEPLARKRPGRAPVEPAPRQRIGLHRYCSGCAHETEHVAWTGDGTASIPSIRWPARELAGDTTICVDCGQWRAVKSHPHLPAWSSWPREQIARRNLDVADPTRAADDWVSEAAAENEGMPPRREPRRARGRRRARVRPVHAAVR